MIRLFDILFSFLGLVVLSPLFVIVLICIILDSPGGGFYMQKRVGKHGKDFLLYKFRSMTVGSDAKGLITIGTKDARVTKTGEFIRKYKLDELPQLINVLKGEMSLVGPRPEVRKYVDIYTPEQAKVLSVVPGITDFASMKYVNENDILGNVENPEEFYQTVILPDKIEQNMIYVNQKSLFLYFKIIFLTIYKIFK